MRFVNTDDVYRTWPHLVNEETGRTLGLEPGEECELKLASADSDFDPYLKPVKGAKGKVDKGEVDGGEKAASKPAIPVV